MLNYTWEIISVDTTSRSMVVNYRSADGAYSRAVNIPMPSGTGTLQKVIETFVPTTDLQAPVAPPRLVQVDVGTTGTGSVDLHPVMVLNSVEDLIRDAVQAYMSKTA